MTKSVFKIGPFFVFLADFPKKRSFSIQPIYFWIVEIITAYSLKKHAFVFKVVKVTYVCIQ